MIKVSRGCVRPRGSHKSLAAAAAAAAQAAGPYRSTDDIRDISEIAEIVGTREQALMGSRTGDTG